MSKDYGSNMEQILANALEPVHAPASLWYRVDAELRERNPEPRRTLARLGLAFGVMLVAVVSVGWYFDRPTQQIAPVNRPAQVVRSHNSCVMCHV
jgi:hypothetical protein